MSERINKGRKRNIVEKKGTIEKSSETIRERVNEKSNFLEKLLRRKKKVKENE